MQNISLWITPPGLVKHGITIESNTQIGITSIELDTKINSFLKVQSEAKQYPDDDTTQEIIQGKSTNTQSLGSIMM